MVLGLLIHPLARIGLLSSVCAAYTFSVEGGVINGSDLADVVADWSPALFVALWVHEDARTTRYWPAFHYGAWLLVLQPLITIHYALRTRGRRGTLLAAGLSTAMLAPIISGYFGWWFYEDLPDFR